MIEDIVKIVKEASQIMTDASFRVMQKDGVANIVTSSDIAVQSYLCDKLSKLLPGSGFCCEEEDYHHDDTEYVWIIDPIDGTCNYSRGIKDCAISVALARRIEAKLQVVSAVVYSPASAELFTAELGKGAYRNGKPIHVSDKPYSNGLYCTAGSVYKKEWAPVCYEILDEVYYQINDFRRFGAASMELCYMAAGMIELYFEFRLMPWDYAAASLILTEAGGVIHGFHEQPIPFDRQSPVVAANSQANLQWLEEIVDKHIKQLPY